MEKAEAIQKLIFFTSEITLLIFFTKITLFEICMLFHQYFPEHRWHTPSNGKSPLARIT